MFYIFVKYSCLLVSFFNYANISTQLHIVSEAFFSQKVNL